MKHARDVMEQALVVAPDLPVADLARRLLDADADGACVLEAGRLVGVVTSMDLVFRQKRFRPATQVALLDLVFRFGVDRMNHELEKIGAANVAGLMSRDVVTVGPDASLEDVATRMVEEHLSLVPVVEGGALVGAVSRRSVVRTTLRAAATGAARG